MQFPDRKTVERLREVYPPGTVVELVRMEDEFAPPVGTRGVITRMAGMCKTTGSSPIYLCSIYLWKPLLLLGVRGNIQSPKGTNKTEAHHED